jgi:hypothetical protein
MNTQEVLQADNRNKAELQLDTQESIKLQVVPMLPVFQSLYNGEIPFSIEYIQCTNEDSFPFWKEALSEPPLSEFGFISTQIKKGRTHYIHEELLERYPTVYPLVYIPALSYRKNKTNAAPSIVVDEALSALKISGGSAFVFYNCYSPVIKMTVENITIHADMLLQFPENVCILAEDFSWLIFRSRENEWSWGYKNVNSDLYTLGQQVTYIHQASATSYQLKKIFAAIAPRMEATFSKEEFDATLDHFFTSGADIFKYIFRGKETWVEVFFEKEESYFIWCFNTFNRDIVPQWKEYFKGFEID